MKLPAEEQIVRAICSDKFDRTSGRVSPSLFKGAGTSVSRLTIIPLALQWRKLAATVQKLPGRKLERLGEINVGHLVQIGQTYVTDHHPNPVSLSVEADPLPTNPAHAVIPESISIGLSNTIIRNLTYHELPEGFDPTKIERMA